MDKDLVGMLRQLRVIYREPIKLRSGKTADYYVDVKKAYGSPVVLDLISESLFAQMDERATCVAAAGYGGIPIASVISHQHGLKLVLVRDKGKNHGRGGLIDGYVPTEWDKVEIIDDVLSTGGSLRDTMKSLEPTGVEILGCHVVVKRGEADLGVPWDYLLTVKDLRR
jgi:orotate phosphoribosyltransferase